MSLSKRNICVISFALACVFALDVSRLAIRVEAARGMRAGLSSNVVQTQKKQQPEEKAIEERDTGQNGITVSEPKIYDDALLQQMLRAAETRLAALQVVDQTAIVARLGAVTGASQQVSGFGLNVQGAPVPGVVTTTKLPTRTTTRGFQTTAGETTEGSDTTTTDETSNSLQTVSNLAVRDVVTTQNPFSAPTAVAPAPSTTLPSSFSVSASDILNEQVQLSAEINGLRLLLAGSLTDHFLKHRPDHKPNEPELTKLRTTLGFHVAVAPNERYKDAVAIVEVEIGVRKSVEKAVKNFVERNLKNEGLKDKTCPSTEPSKAECIKKLADKIISDTDRPAVTALIPREKTYNVAAISDKSVSIGAGVATQIVGISGSWLWGRKTHYLVQDQDTLALTYQPVEKERIGFRWQFRPVLGQRYVKAGLKQTFVQLAFPTVSDAIDGEIGQVAVHTYWRKYDRKSGILKQVIPNSYRVMYKDVDIPSFKQPVEPAFDASQVEDLGDGNALVRLEGRFLPGTYVRIGGIMVTEGAGLKFEHNDIKFTAPIATLATKNVLLVAHDGREKLLTFPCEKPIEIKELSLSSIDDTNSKLSIRVSPAEIAAQQEPKMLIVIGQRVFGYSDAPLLPFDKNNPDTLAVIVPNKIISPTATVVVKPLFAEKKCITNPQSIGKPPKLEKLALLARDKESVKFLLTGTNLSTLYVLSPADAILTNIPNTDANTMRLLTLKAAHLLTHKQVFVQRGKDEPFLISIPSSDPPASPKALGSIGLMRDDVMIVGEGMSNVEGITFKDQPFTSFKILNDQTLLLTGLAALNASSSAGPLRFFIKFKSETKPRVVDVQVVTSRDDSLESPRD